MRILIELPTWLGDTVMATPAIENLTNFFDDSQITLIGSYVAVDALKNHPKVIKAIVLDKKYSNLYSNGKILGEFDFFFSFRGSIRSKFLKFSVAAKAKFQFDKRKYNKMHQVEKYNNFINDSLNTNTIAGKLILHNIKKSKNDNNKLLGINPGASYGSAKRWTSKEFANVAFALSSEYDIVIFGGPGEIGFAADIEKYLIEKNVNNYQNLTAKTTITELIDQISSLDLFITGDSGPMHIAAVFQVPTVAIFGPTNDNETSQWLNEKSLIVKKSLECQPCMKRTCPLEHQNCMKLIKASDVLNAVKSLN
jgi:heptosyltransferase II